MKDLEDSQEEKIKETLLLEGVASLDQIVMLVYGREIMRQLGIS